MLHGKELDRCFLAKIRNKARYLLAPLKVIANEVRYKKKIKKFQIVKKEI